MTNLADGTTWTEGEPAIGDPRYLGQQEIRGLRTGVRRRIEKEHETPTTGGSWPGMEHKAGSAKAYRQDGAPTNRPDGSTALNASDAGRLWIDSNDNEKIYVYNGSAWVLSTNTPTIGAVTTLSGGDQTNLRSDSGWTNSTGSLVALYAEVIDSADQELSIEYNHSGGGWFEVGAFRHGTGNTNTFTLVALVANGSAVRVRRGSAAMPIGNLVTAHYQRF